MARQTPKGVVRLMTTCRRLLVVGKTACVWTDLRSKHRLLPPKPHARKYKTDYDVFRKKSCRCCFAALADQYGFCQRCRWQSRKLACAYANLYSAQKLANSTYVRLRNGEKRVQALKTCHDVQRQTYGNAVKHLLVLSGAL